jgi:hypothetical protein
MIQLPSSLENASPLVRAHFDRFLATGIAKSLEQDTASWEFLAWPRVDGFPARFILRNETREEVELIFFDNDRYTTTRRDPSRSVVAV